MVLIILHLAKRLSLSVMFVQNSMPLNVICSADRCRTKGVSVYADDEKDAMAFRSKQAFRRGVEKRKRKRQAQGKLVWNMMRWKGTGCRV